MTLNASGPISIGGSTSGQSINLELGRAAGAQSSLGETALRTLASVASGAIDLQDFYGKSNFSPTTRTYTTGTGATETVPSGAANVRIRCWGGGGAGSRHSTDVGGGGGGGGFTERSYACSGGQTLIYTVGASVAGRSTNGAGSDGNNSTVSSGTLTITTQTASGGGGGGLSDAGGTGGNATGGTTNTVGEDGSTDGISLGGDCLGTGGGIGGGISNQDGTAPGGGGSGGSSGTSGAGARGQVEFYYT